MRWRGMGWLIRVMGEIRWLFSVMVQVEGRRGYYERR
jgi:hypothetical protein